MNHLSYKLKNEKYATLFNTKARNRRLDGSLPAKEETKQSPLGEQKAGYIPG